MAEEKMFTTGSASFAVQSQNYFNKNLLKTTLDTLQMEKLCTRYPLPANMGTKTMTMFKRTTRAQASDVKELTEGTPDDNWSRTELESLDITIKQYGDKSKMSDVASQTELFNQLKLESKRMGESCALKIDQLIMSEAVLNSTQKLYAGSKTFAELKSATAGASNVLSCAKVLAIAQFLKKKRAPKFAGGYYVAVLTPEQVFDLQQDADWKDLNVHNRGGKAIFKNEIGEIHGVKILETTAGWVEGDTEGTLVEDGNIFTGLFMGSDVIGIADLAGAPSARKPVFIHNNKADKSDPLNQFQTIGWKGFFAQKLLQPEWLVTLRTKTLMPTA